jgi:putative nucleotidyltransferase with HDIG domain
VNKELETAIMTATDLPTIPVVAIKVMQLIESESATAEALAKIVASDPAVAARVLKISNSSFFGCRRQIQTISNAIVILGFNTLRSLVVTASLKQVYKPFGLTEKMLWEHSFAAGLAAKTIAQESRTANEEEAFLAGLFHDIGKIIMNSLDREKFQEVMEHCYNEGIPFKEAERGVYPYGHEEVGSSVIKKWNFPDNLATAVLQHHTLQFAVTDSPALINLTAVTALADQFCLKLGIGVREPWGEIDLARSKAGVMLKLSERNITATIKKFCIAFEKDRALFSG